MVVQLRDQIKSFLLAGHETSAAMLTWTVYQLALNPACHARVLEEFGRGVDDVLRDHGHPALARSRVTTV